MHALYDRCFSQTSRSIKRILDSPAMPSSSKSEIVAMLRVAACERVCLSCWFPCCAAYLDETLAPGPNMFCLFWVLACPKALIDQRASGVYMEL